MTLEEALQEIDRLRAANQHLLQFVIQKCPRCGTVVAPDPAEQWPSGVAECSGFDPGNSVRGEAEVEAGRARAREALAAGDEAVAAYLLAETTFFPAPASDRRGMKHPPPCSFGLDSPCTCPSIVGSDGHRTWCPVPYPDDHEGTCLDQLILKAKRLIQDRAGEGEAFPSSSPLPGAQSNGGES